MTRVHTEAGAEMVRAGDCMVPRSYGDLRAEYLAVTERAGAFDISLRGKVLVSGEDAVPFLQGVISTDVSGMASGMWAYGAMLEPRGKYLADLKVFRLGCGVLLDCPPFTAPAVAGQLAAYKFRLKASIVDLTEARALFSLQGPQAAGIAMAAGVGVPDAEHSVLEHAEGAARIAASLDETGCGGFWIWCGVEQAPDLWRRLLQGGARPCGLEVLRTLRIESGVPAWGIDIDESVIPMEAGQERALCFEKCYPGQEVVSRIHFRGHVNRCLQILDLKSDSDLPPGARIRSDSRDVGMVTSVARNPVSGRITGLGYVRRETLLAGRPLVVEWEGGSCAAVARALPYCPIS